jgi:hypothetical protein
MTVFAVSIGPSFPAEHIENFLTGIAELHAGTPYIAAAMPYRLHTQASHLAGLEEFWLNSEI